MPRALILDAEAVSALARKRRGMAERLTAAQRADHRVLIPAVVLAEVASGAASHAAIRHIANATPHRKAERPRASTPTHMKW